MFTGKNRKYVCLCSSCNRIDSPLLDVLYRVTELDDVCPIFAARQIIFLGYYPNIDYNKLTNYIGSAHL
jgi:hypothetical protein